MNAAKSCPDCSSPLAADQRYCLNCGKRLGRLTVPGALVPMLRGPAVAGAAPGRAAPSWLPIAAPGPKLGAVLTAAALGLGLYVGGLVSGGYPGMNIATGSPFLGGVLPAGDGGSGSGSTASLGSPVGNVAGGGGTAAPGAPAAAVPAAVAAPVTTPTITPTTTTPAGGGKQTAPQGQTISGTVLHVNPNAHSYLLASSGPLVPIHSKSLPAVGTKVKAPVDPLFNGTFGENGKRTASGKAQQATFTGTVSFRDPDAHSYSVSGRGYSVLVQPPSDGSPPPDPPQLGAEVKVVVAISVPPAARSRGTSNQDPGSPPSDPGAAGEPAPAPADAVPPPTSAAAAPPVCPPEGTAPVTATSPSPAVLTQQSVTVQGQATGSVDLEGIVQSGCPDTKQLAISADDVRQAGRDVVLAVPDGIDFTKLVQGHSFDITATIAADGSYVLTGAISDDGSKGADDSSTAQGDQAG